MEDIIKNLDFMSNPDCTEGTFTSKIFMNEDSDKMSVYMENFAGNTQYAAKCINHFNSMPDEMIDEICEGIIESCHLSDEESELPELENVRDILEYCWFTSMAVDIPEDDGISYVIEGEGDWGEIVGFVIKDGSLAYVGIDFEEYL